MNASARVEILKLFAAENQLRLNGLQSADMADAVRDALRTIIELQMQLWDQSCPHNDDLPAASIAAIDAARSQTQLQERYFRFPYFVNADLDKLHAMIVNMENNQLHGQDDESCGSFDNKSTDVEGLMAMMNSAEPQEIWAQAYKLDQYSRSYFSDATCVALSYDVLCARASLPGIPYKKEV